MEGHTNRFIIFPDEDDFENKEITNEEETTINKSEAVDSFHSYINTNIGEVSDKKEVIEENKEVQEVESTNFDPSAFFEQFKVVPSSNVLDQETNSIEQEDNKGVVEVIDKTSEEVENEENSNFVLNNTIDIDDPLKDIGTIEKDEDGRIILDAMVEEEQGQEEVKEDVTEEKDLILEKEIEVDYNEEESNNLSNAYKQNQSLQDMINKILKIDNLNPVKVDVGQDNERRKKEQEIEEKRRKDEEELKRFHDEIRGVIKTDERKVLFKSDLLDKIKAYSDETGKFSMLVRYGEDYCNKDFVTNPAIGRDDEIKQLILTLLTPEKSAILIGKPGIGKTSIVEGLAYRLQRCDVPEALQGFTIINIKTPSLLGTLPTGETRLQTLVDELKSIDKIILFIDEIHMLIGATNESAMDFANMFKEGLGRGQIKVIGATTTEEYERYILRDKAFVRRFQSIEVLEPNREHTIKILMGTLPKIENETGAKLKYTPFIQSEIMGFITDITSEYKRVYGIGSRYPDICLTLLKEAFSQCIFDNRDKVTIFDVRDAIENSKNIYPDVIRKELPNFDEKFKKIITEEREEDASIDRL